MEENKTNLLQLARDWQSLYREIQKNGKFSFDVFNDLFTKTYQLLCQKVSEPSIEKSLLPVIVNASLFAHTEISDKLEPKHKAALILTERMLTTLLSEKRSSPCSETAIYIFELRQDICIDFSDVNGSVNTLAKLYEADYWDSLCK